MLSHLCKRLFSTAVPKTFDVVVVGGGGIGASCSHFLANKGLRVCVIEKDRLYKYCSTSLSVGSIRQQFSTPENIQLSLFGAHFLRNITDHLGVDGEPVHVTFCEGGYLFLASPGRGEEILRENHQVQKAHGADNALLTPSEITARFPWMSTEGVALGCLGLSMEGWFDPYSLLCAFRNKAKAQGVVHIDGEAVKIDQNRVQVKCNGGNNDLLELECKYIINASGAWAANTCEMAGITPVPVKPRRRQVFVFQTPNELTDCPLLIDPTGVYMRRETTKNTYLCGYSPSEENDPDCTCVDDLKVDGDFFTNEIWPVLANRVPSLEDLRVVGGWAGFYEYNTFDQNAIIGPHPEMPNFILANGFSGHGIQQAAGVGRGIAELIDSGKYHSIDLSPFSFSRVLENRPLFEKNIV